MTIATPFSPRRASAEVLSAAIRAYGLTNPLGGEIELSNWGRGKRYCILAMLPRTTDAFAYVNAPDQIEIISSIGKTHIQPVTLAQAVGLIYSLWVAYDSDLTNAILDGEQLAGTVPPEMLAAIKSRLPEGIDLPAGLEV